MINQALLKELAKAATAKAEAENQNGTVYGTVNQIDGDDIMVLIDGGESTTPAVTAVTVNVGDRVKIEIKDHSAVITGNITDISASAKVVEEVVTFKTNAENGGETVIDGGAIKTKTVKAEQVDVDDLFAENIEAKGKITGAKLYGAYAEISGGKIGRLLVDENRLYSEYTDENGATGTAYLISDEEFQIAALKTTKSVNKTTGEPSYHANTQAMVAGSKDGNLKLEAKERISLNASNLDLYSDYGLTLNDNTLFRADGVYTGKTKVQGYSESRAAYPIATTWNDTSGAKIHAMQGNGSTNQLIIYGEWGTIGAYTGRSVATSTSDARLKKNIKESEVDNALEQIMKIPMYSYDWIESGEHIDNGFVAQKLEEINPKMVFAPNSDESYYGVNTFYLISMLTKAIQELNEKANRIEKALER